MFPPPFIRPVATLSRPTGEGKFCGTITDNFTDSGRSNCSNSLLLTQQNLQARVGIEPSRFTFPNLTHSVSMAILA
jgi:hypothetical protein